MWEDWMQSGLCKRLGDEPDLWFDEDDSEKVKRAKAFCNMCPVKQKCLEYSVVHRIKFGIWGGEGVKERLALMKEVGVLESSRPVMIKEYTKKEKPTLMTGVKRGVAHVS